MAITLRDYAQQTGLDVGYDPTKKTVSLGGKTLAPNQLQALGGTLTDGSWNFGDTSKLDTLTGKQLAPAPTVAPTVAPTPTTTPTVVASSIATQQMPTQNIQSSIADLEKQKKINEFERAYQQSIGKLQQEEEKAIKGFEGERSQTRTSGIMNAKAFENFLANQGISASGTAPQGFIQQQGQVQGRLGASRLQQQQYSTDIGRQRAQLGSDLEFNKAQADIDAQLQASKQAYEQQLIQQGWDREDAIRESDRAYDQSQQADELARSDFQNTIMARYNDLQAFANELISQGAPQWQIDQVLAARQQKIADQGLDQQGRPIATTPQISSSVAYDLWKQLGTANESVAQALGVPVGTRFTEQARATGGSSSGGSSAGVDAVATQTPKQVIAYAESNLRGTSGSTSADVMVKMNDAGLFENLTPAEIKSLMNKFGVTELMLEQAENRTTIPTQGITLPTGRVVGQGSSGLTGMTNTIR